MSDWVTHSELDAAIDAVRADIQETEQRLRKEWTDTVRYEVGRVSGHLSEQDIKINWILGLIVALLVSLLGSSVYVVLHYLH